MEHMRITKLDEKSFNTLKVEMIEKVRVSKNIIEDVNSKIEATDNYLARYLPFNNFCSQMEVMKIVLKEFLKNPNQKDKFEEYEHDKMEDLYSLILFDDGRAPDKFEKDFLVVGRQEINQRIQKNKNKKIAREREEKEMEELAAQVPEKWV